jgi:hypothetical protein
MEPVLGSAKNRVEKNRLTFFYRKRLRRSQIFIDPEAKKSQLHRSDICLGRLVTFGCVALDAAPSGADSAKASSRLNNQAGAP